MWFQNIKEQSLPPAAARSRSRSNIAQEGEAEASSQEAPQELLPEEVLVISIGSGPQTVPGMMSENEVMNASGINGLTRSGDDGRDQSPDAFPAVTETKWCLRSADARFAVFLLVYWRTILTEAPFTFSLARF